MLKIISPPIHHFFSNIQITLPVKHMKIIVDMIGIMQPKYMESLEMDVKLI